VREVYSARRHVSPPEMSIYLHYFNSYSATYGSLGALLWFYITGLALLIGDEINAEIEQ
jgi:membrane protein